MASSGSWYTNFGGGHYQLTLSWSASQSVSGNYSDISAKLYITCFGGWSISANATKYGNITIDGDQIDFTTVIGSVSAGNTPKQLASASKRVYHNADGSKYLNITASLGVDVTISGVGHIGTVNVNSSNSLDNIPRASSVSLANFTAGDNVTVNISRASGNFTHSIQLDVGGVAIKTASGVGTSHTWSFTEADIKKIYAAMGSASSASATVWCNTYSGSTLVGDAHTNATCYQVGNSALQTAPTFVVGDSRTYTVNRLRGSVSHTLQLFAGSTLIRTATGVGTSYSLTLTEAEIAKIYALGTSVATKMVCTAYHCGRNIGTSQLTGTASAPPVSSITSKPDHTIGSGYTTSISRSRNAVSHTLRLYVAGQMIKEIGGVATAYTWTPTAAEVAAEYAATPNSNTAAAQATVWCYHYGKLIGTATAGGTATVDPAAAAPIFSGFSFADTRTETTALTGDDQVLVAGESTLKVIVPAAQAAKSTTGASIKQYILYCGGSTATGGYAASGDVSIQMERAKAGSVRLAAVDSRGNQTVVERLAALVDYIPPRVTQMQLRRDNNVDNKTKLTVKGVWWPGNFGAVDNALEARYRYKVTSAGEFVEGATVPLAFQKGEWSYEGYLPGDMGAEGFDFRKSFSVEVTVEDVLNAATETGTVDRGIPTMHMDKGGVGIGKIRENGALDVEGDTHISGAIDGSRSAHFSEAVDIGGALTIGGSATVKGNLYSNLNWAQSQRDFSIGTLIQTSIAINDNGQSAPFFLEIKGNLYAGGGPAYNLYQGYYYSKTVYNSGKYETKPLSGFVSFRYKGKLCFWFPRQQYWQGFTVYCTAVNPNQLMNTVTSITDATQPSTEWQFSGWVDQWLNRTYPVGSYWIGHTNTSPASLFGGTWYRVESRFLWAGPAGSTIGATGGEQTHVLTVNEMPKHSHTLNQLLGGSGGLANDGGTVPRGYLGSNYTNLAADYPSNYGISSTGASAAHNNIPPYINVAIWRRTA
ncbi:DUF859 family phage minor structural protein [Bittarella massiliensis (ex Durand et al. 2017)]|uniref:DUF859 family phage minor structural protein n=1 Tax=Bittarella massiliensis (ex Durand et al. 2017) TaxID=1720313 RepID=UPI00073F68A7|nr:DUF859 family phage minor structural protein [Bittarella massiliensis (ex Durand et al. 2017)]